MNLLLLLEKINFKSGVFKLGTVGSTFHSLSPVGNRWYKLKYRRTKSI